MLVVVAIIGILVELLLPAISAVRVGPTRDPYCRQLPVDQDAFAI